MEPECEVRRGISCFQRPGAIDPFHNELGYLDAASLGFAIRDGKEHGVCQLTYAPLSAAPHDQPDQHRQKEYGNR